MTGNRLPLAISIRPEIIDGIGKLATYTGRDLDSMIEHALESYLVGSEGSALHEEAGGFDELDEGRFADLDEVLKKASSLVDDAEAKRARRAG